MIDQNQTDGGTQNEIEGDTHNPETELHSQQIAFPGGVTKAAVKYKPTRDIILLDWEPKTNLGGIIIPEKSQKAMNLSFYTIPVLAVGPDCKVVKASDSVLLPAEAILTVRFDGRVAYFCNEQKVLAVVE